MSFRLPFSSRPVHSATSSQLEVKGVRDLDIAEVAQRSGVPASALRYYEEKGLIASIGRRGLRRLFDPGVLERLALIALGRAAGFSLAEIALMFAPDDLGDRLSDAAVSGRVSNLFRHFPERQNRCQWQLDHLWRERNPDGRSEEQTSELQSLMRISYAVFCLKKKKRKENINVSNNNNINEQT